MEDKPLLKPKMDLIFQKFSGDDYKLKRVVAILIVGYKLINAHSEYHDTFNYHSRKTGHTFSKSTEIHTLELNKLPDKDDGTMLWSWLKFIKSEERRDFEMLAQKSEMVGKAVSVLEKISADEAMRLRAHAIEMAEWRDKAIRIEGENKARAEGVNAGIDMGIDIGLDMGIEKMIFLIKQGYTPEEAAVLAKKKEDN